MLENPLQLKTLNFTLTNLFQKPPYITKNVSSTTSKSSTQCRYILNKYNLWWISQISPTKFKTIRIYKQTIFTLRISLLATGYDSWWENTDK